MALSHFLMIMHQPVENYDDMRKVTDNILRDAGLTTGMAAAR